MTKNARRALALAVGLAGCGAETGTSPGSASLPAALAPRLPIDGIPDFSVMGAVEERTLEFIDGPTGGTARQTWARWGIVNDDRDLYLAIEWDDDTHDNTVGADLQPLDFDGIRLLLDEDGDGYLEPGEDVKTVITAGPGSHYLDLHGATGAAVDLIGDGFGKLTWDGAGRYRAELLFPLAADARGEDAALTASTRYNILIFDHVRTAQGAGAIAALHPAVEGSTGWPRIPLRAVPRLARPELPRDLRGRIAFISSHEEPNGEIYFFDPATRAVTRVTRLPDLFKDNVSLSHDGRRLAFHAAASPSDVLGYEVFVVEADGSGLQQLTSNRVLDGHPAWSPDDTHLVYASFRDPYRSAIVVVTAAGAERAVLTPAGVHDNDPEYLPDGRIVFKTDRFSPAPEVRIAVMGEDGSGVRPLTFRTGVSDHDPSGSSERVLFERFPEPPGSGGAALTGWDLVEVPMDGSGERLLLRDGWSNWLPVFDPSRRYVAYQKSTGGYTAVHLMSASGQEIGRLIPGITRIRYLDWK